MTLNEERARRGWHAIGLHPDYPTGSVDPATAGSDVIADILHALFGVYDPLAEHALLDRALRCWVGDAEDEPVPDKDVLKSRRDAWWEGL